MKAEAMSLPEPMRVNAATIARCRKEIEAPFKALCRTLVLPIVKARWGFAELGEGFQWGHPLGIPRGQLRVGRYSYIGARLELQGPLVIGDLCLLSTHIRVVGNDHLTNVIGSPTRLAFARRRLLTVIEADCWIGKGAMIREGICIGRGAVVGAGSIVTKSVGPYEIVAGNPARLLRMRFTPAEIEAHDRALYASS